WWIRYPTEVTTEFRLVSDNLPKTIVARGDGRLEAMLVNEGQVVKKDQVLGYMESSADYQQVLQLGQEIDRLGRILASGNYQRLGGLETARFDRLGDIQEDYRRFREALAKVKSM